MSKNLAAMFVLLATACGGPVISAPVEHSADLTPRSATFAIDPTMPAAQAEVVRDVVQTWCETRSRCLVEVGWTWGDVRVFWATNYSQYNRPPTSCAFTTAGDQVVRVNADRPDCTGDLDIFWRVSAHEFGHIFGYADDDPTLEIMAGELKTDGPLAIE